MGVILEPFIFVLSFLGDIYVKFVVVEIFDHNFFWLAYFSHNSLVSYHKIQNAPK